MATQEVDRYTFGAPGKATSYFYGYTRMLDMRQARVGGWSKFDAQTFHDFVLSQGALPLPLLRDAVEQKFGLR